MTDARFYFKKNIGFLCEFCGRGPKRHKKIKGAGEFIGWTRYECKSSQPNQFIRRKSTVNG